MTTASRDQVFISYSHKDKKWLNALLTHLKPYARSSTITMWSDNQIQPGSKWFEQIREALNKTNVAVLLVTPHFLASEFIHEHELTPFLADAATGGMTILWIPVRASSYAASPLQKYRAIIDPEKPLAEMKEKRDAAWVHICQTIEKISQKPVAPPQQEPVAPPQQELVDPPQQDRASIVAGRVNPAPTVRHADAKPYSHRPLLRDIERAVADGELQNAKIVRIVFEAMNEEACLELSSDYDPIWITRGIRISDEYRVRVRESAGLTDWQHDCAQTATPTLVGMTRSLQRSADAHALVIRLFELVASEFKLRLIWPEDPDQHNDLKNEIYQTCLKATDLECDEVLAVLKKVTVVGPQ
jgi:hypothetical protein